MAPPPINSRNILLDICASVRDEEIDMSNALPRAAAQWEHGEEIAYKRLIQAWQTQISDEEALNDRQSEAVRQNITADRHGIFKRLSCLLNAFEESSEEEEEHAIKLSFLFPSATAALKWLDYFAKHNTTENPIETLCRAVVINLAQAMPPYRQIGQGNLQRLFRNLKELSHFTGNLDLIASKVSPRTTFDDLKLIIQENKRYTFEHTIGCTIEKLTPEEQAALTRIRNINKRFNRAEFEDAYDILTLLKQAQNSDKALPNLVVRSEDIGLLPGYYMIKLNEKDPRGALIGHFLGCCQHIASPQGKNCVKHAITSPLGATYAIFKGHVTEGQTNINQNCDPLEAGSWAWRNGDMICFDSIEYDIEPIRKNRGIQYLAKPLSGATHEQVIAYFYTAFAQRMIEKDATLNKVTVGFSPHARTPKCAGLPETMVEFQMEDKPIRYTPNGEVYSGHTDAHRQRTLTTRTLQSSVKATALTHYRSDNEVNDPGTTRDNNFLAPRHS